MGGRPAKRGGAGLAERADRAEDAARGDESLPIVDAHHHLWDLTANRHPWLSDEPPIPFRYGDYSAIRRNYLAADYRRELDATGPGFVDSLGRNQLEGA